MYVVKAREITDSMYIIHTGKVRGICDETKKVRAYQAGRYFGELQGLIHDLPFSQSFITTTKAQVLTLRLNDWEGLLDHFPSSKKYINKHLDDVYKSYENNGDDQDGSGGQSSSSPVRDLLSSLASRMYSPSPSPSTTIKEEKQKVRGKIFFPPPGPSQTYMPSPSINKAYAWPTDAKSSVSSLSSTHALESDLKASSSKKEKVKRTLSFEKLKPSTSKAVRVDKHMFSYESIDNKQERLEEHTKNVERLRHKSTSELKSVEDYITEQHGNEDISWLDQMEPSVAKNQKDSLPSVSSKKAKSRVRYREGTPLYHPIDTHELKLKSMSAEERNLRSLDSDVPLGVKVSIPEKKKGRVEADPSTASTSSSDSDLREKENIEESRKK